MEFEQLSIDQQKFDQPYLLRYLSLDNEGKIYSKIDWLTAIFENCSLNHVLYWLKLDDSVSDFFASQFEQSRGYDQVFKYIYNGVMLETSSFNFYGEDLSVALFDKIVPKIRLELSGAALDYLRSCGLDMDSYRFVPPLLPDGGSFHFTRCDFAYDFINYMPDFVDLLIDHINLHRLPSERVPLASTKGAIGCRVVTGGQKTVYLGSPQSDTMLRVYDKRMEQMDLNTQTYKKANPYGDPASWFRIEWQTRNRLAHNLVLDQTQDFLSILKEIFTRYAFADGTVDVNHHKRTVVDFWLKLFKWEEVERRIIQNAKYVQTVSPEQRLVDHWNNIGIVQYMLIKTLLCAETREERCNQYLRNLYRNDPVSYRRLNALLNKINNMKSLKIGQDGSPDCGLWNNCGRLAFRE